MRSTRSDSGEPSIRVTGLDGCEGLVRRIMEGSHRAGAGAPQLGAGSASRERHEPECHENRPGASQEPRRRQGSLFGLQNASTLASKATFTP